MSITDCCVKGFEWSGTPSGRIEKLAGLDTYVSGPTDSPAAVLVIHDLFGWTFPNLRLLADHYAREAGVTAYLPDFFGGLSVPLNLLLEEKWADMDLPTFFKTNGREQREPDIFASARALREKHAKVGAVGYCYGGWACMRLAATEHATKPGGRLVDCITVAHPSLQIPSDFEGIDPAIPVQILAPEIDKSFHPEQKKWAFELLQKKGCVFEYLHFPGVEHACFSRGDENHKGERQAMVRGKNVVVSWLKQYIKNQE